MHHKKAVACASAVVLALAVACSKNAETPVSPSSAQPGSSEAGPNGETLKATAPTPQSPVNNAQPDQLVLTTAKATGKFDQGLATAYSYEFQIMNTANTTVCSTTLGGRVRFIGQLDAHVHARVRRAAHLARARDLPGRHRSVVGDGRVPLAGRRLHPRQRDLRPAHERPHRRQCHRRDASSETPGFA